MYTRTYFICIYTYIHIVGICRYIKMLCKMGEGGFAGAEGYDPILTMTQHLL
jgi:hypothetical protein